VTSRRRRTSRMSPKGGGEVRSCPSEVIPLSSMLGGWEMSPASARRGA
jgi:hypothetical protein